MAYDKERLVMTGTDSIKLSQTPEAYKQHQRTNSPHTCFHVNIQDFDAAVG